MRSLYRFLPFVFGAVVLFTTADSSQAAVPPDAYELATFGGQAGTVRDGAVAAPDGSIYLATDRTMDRAVRSEDRLYAFRSDGTLKWSLPLAPYGKHNGSILQPKTSANGTVFVDYANKLLAFTPDGTKIWESAPSDNSVYYGLSRDNILYVWTTQRGSGLLRAYDASFKEIWSRPIDKVHDQIFVGDDGVIYLNGDLLIHDQKAPLIWYAGTIALQPDGSFKFGEHVDGSASKYVSYSLAQGIDGTIYTTRSAQLLAIDRDGKERWRASIDGKPDVGRHFAPVVGIDGTVYVDDGGYLHALSPDGIKRWAFDLAANGIDDLHDVAVGTDGTLYLAGVQLAPNPNMIIHDVIVIALSPEGVEQWRKIYVKNDGFPSLTPYYDHLLLGTMTHLFTLPQTKLDRGTPQVSINGEMQSFDQPPVVLYGRTLVPVRFISEALSAKVDWNDAAKQVTLQKGDIEVKLTYGLSKAMVNGKEVQLDVSPFALHDRTMLPLRFITETLGAQVEWDEAANTVRIKQN